MTKENDNDLEGLFMAIGYLCQSWAMLEQSLDMWIAMIYHKAGGHSHINKVIPVSLKSKLEFLRRSFKTIDPLKIFCDEAVELLNKVSSISRRRHDLVHGVITHHEPVNGKWHMTIFDYETPKDKINWHVSREFTFSPNEFQDLEAKILPLALEIASFPLRQTSCHYFL